jgi:L-iditol 2-dehydrogenase
MQALVMTKINELRILEVPDPRLEEPEDVLIRVKAAGICGSDLHGYTGQTGRRTPPLIMGHEATGVVVATGSAVDDLIAGTPVAIHPIDRRGTKRLMGMDAPGAYAPYVVWPASNLHRLPDSVSFEAGSLAEPLAVAVHATRRAGLDDVTSALVVGAGPIGLLVASILKHRGVGWVAVTDLSEERLRVARELGVDVTLNPSEEDTTAAIWSMTGGKGVDVAFEAVGIGPTVAQAHAAVRDGGTVVWIGNHARTIEVDMQQVVTRELDIRGSYGMTGRDFDEAIALLATGAVKAEMLINRYARLEEGPTLFDELIASPDVIKCVFTFP